MTDIEKHEDSFEYIGSFIKSYRLAQKESLQSLADRSGVSRSMIGQIESQQTSPTLSVLAKLARAMDINLGDLVEPPEASFGLSHNIATQDNIVSKKDSPFVCHLLTSRTAQASFEIYRFYFLHPGKTAFSANVRGSIKNVWLEHGDLTISISNFRTKLEPDSLTSFRASIPHNFESRGKELAKGILFVNY